MTWLRFIEKVVAAGVQPEDKLIAIDIFLDNFRDDFDGPQPPPDEDQDIDLDIHRIHNPLNNTYTVEITG